jgi:YfiR/HmsC-like
LIAWSASAQANPSSEYAVKAAFLFHFAQFVEWPPEAFKNAAAPLTYCTVGEDPFNGALEGALSGKNIGTHPIRVEHVKQAQELQSCQILFIGIAEKKHLAATLESVKSNPVLTVGDSEHFAQLGGMIGFCQEENKIRFEINLGAAASARLRISAKLLSLAKTVLGHSEGAA